MSNGWNYIPDAAPEIEVIPPDLSSEDEVAALLAEANIKVPSPPERASKPELTSKPEPPLTATHWAIKPREWQKLFSNPNKLQRLREALQESDPALADTLFEAIEISLEATPPPVAKKTARSKSCYRNDRVKEGAASMMRFVGEQISLGLSIEDINLKYYANPNSTRSCEEDRVIYYWWESVPDKPSLEGVSYTALKKDWLRWTRDDIRDLLYVRGGKQLKTGEVISPLEPPKTYPNRIDSPGKKAIFDLTEDAALTQVINAAVLVTKKDSWRNNKVKQREIRKAIADSYRSPNKTQADLVFEIVKNHEEY